MIKYKAINRENIREVFKFKANDLEGAKDYVKNNLDPKKSWVIFIDEDN